MSKEQIAAALNEQSERFKVMRHQLEAASRVLVAIALEPEAFQYRDGFPSIEVTALEKVKNGMTIHLEPVGDVLRLRVVQPGQPDLVAAAPHITIPS